MAWTREHLEALEEALAQGVRTIQVDGKIINYQTTSQMLALRRQMRQELGIERSNRVGMEYRGSGGSRIEGAENRR